MISILLPVNQNDVEKELIRSKQEINIKNQQTINYYHDNLDRHGAEKLLKEAYNSGNGLEGIYLIRKCSACPDDFSLSMICKNMCYHFRINHSIDAYYVLDDGPLIHGLDELIKHYQNNPHGLPCRLNTKFIPKYTLPANSRAIGNTNPLHFAVACISEVKRVKLILKSQNRPDVNEKDDNGRTALHIACEYDNINAVQELLEAGALPNIRAKDGSTPLHTAAEFGSIQCLEYLLTKARANPMERNMTNNWVALHEAASRDHYTCVNALLNHGLPDKPRTSENQTPLDLAIEAGHEKTAHILMNYIPPESRFEVSDFLHDARVTREVAKQILENYKDESECSYLVRKTQRNENILVLSLMCNSEFFNYEICIKDQQQANIINKYYFIDDGPFFRSLCHLIEHYSRYEDGLPGLLVRPISQYGNISRNPIISSSTVSTGHNVSDAFTKASFFKSKTLLNDQKRRNASQLTKKLNKISMSEIQLQSIIGVGEFGTVYKATYNGKQVAVKKLKDCSASGDFMREADIMGTLNNPCILRIYGLIKDRSCLMMVQELMICSVLEKLLETNSREEVTENDLKLWASQIALGMQHMEEQKIVHRDLAARNVLLASMSQIKISDFGLSRSTDALTNAYTQKTDGKIPIKWYAPESIDYLKFTSKSDVWSYGITLWEMFSYGTQPYGNMSGADVYRYLHKGGRLSYPEGCPKNTYRIMLKCWDWQEEDRPTFSELNKFFQNDSDYQKTLPILRAFR